VSVANFIYSLQSNSRTSFVNTVTSSRLKWIDSLRDKVSEFLAVTRRLSDTRFPSGEQTVASLLLQRDTLLHQIVLHLNPRDPEDQKVRELVDYVRDLTDEDAPKDELSTGLDQLRDAAADYLKKQWDRVKKESTEGQS